MKRLLFLFVLLIFSSEGFFAQTLTGAQLVDKSIKYHDPNGNWKRFNETFQVTMETPGKSKRISDLKIDLLNDIFELKMRRDGKKTKFSLVKGNCTTSITDSITQPGTRTPCETAMLYKDYYTYLYGLPMKLKDPGTMIDPKVERVNFKDKEYLKVKVTYEESVGTDVWFFYFNPKTYAMEVYQFYKGDPETNGKATGEYIMLSEETMVEGIKMPKIRAWYYNKDDQHLGTDVITSN